MKPTSRVWHGL